MKNNIFNKCERSFTARFLSIIIAIVMLAFTITSFCSCENIGFPTNQGGNNDNEGVVDADKQSGGNNNSNDPGDEVSIPTDDDITGIEADDKKREVTFISEENGTYVYEYADGEETKQAEVTIKYSSGTENAYTVSGNTITFGAVSANSVYTISGEFFGNIVIDGGSDYAFELGMSGFSVTSYKECPIAVLSGDKVTISAKSGTENFIYDLREKASEEEHSGSIFADCDLAIQGKGALNVKSVNNNGIHTKDDLSVKNLTLKVECVDNALKGNDEVKIESGNLTLIAHGGDGIKTSNSALSKKGKQKGSVIITGGTLAIYAACDGIDAAYDVSIDESSTSANIAIYTDRYSKFTQDVTVPAEEKYYIRFSSTTYKYSLYYYNDENSGVWENSSSYTAINSGRTAYYYYEVKKHSEYSKVKLYIYSSAQSQGQSENCVACSDGLTLNNSYDTIAITSRSGSLSLGWTNKASGGGMGGMNDGNTDKGDYSTKGIKADNTVAISAGMINISSYDDGIHANNDVAIESGVTPLGNVTISGGDITIYTNDDGIHADNTLSISGGNVAVKKSYEGLEGAFVIISGGEISVISSDDGVNGTNKSGSAITISGGNLYVCAGGDGLDSNSTTRYEGIAISGGTAVVISTGSMDAAIDNENGYVYIGGYVVAISTSGGMSGESRNCQNFSSVGTSANISVSAESFVTVTSASRTVAAVQMPKSQNSAVVYLGSNKVSIVSVGAFAESVNANGVYWNVN